LINPYIFREYDIRGVIDIDFTEETLSLLGKGFGTYFKQAGIQSISIGGDVRKSTPFIQNILIKELSQTGLDVVDIGSVPTPVQYFSMYHLPVEGGVMITGSHNPPDYNGFKISLRKAPVFGEEIQKIKSIIDSGNFSTGNGSVEKISVLQDYMDNITNSIQIKKSINVILDSGNGAAGIVAQPLFKALGVDSIDLYPDPDGRFPNHHPDPTVVENIQDLIKSVKERNADFGVGYDGDGDRIGVVDEKGQIIWGDKLMMIFSQEILKNHPGAPIIFEVKCSQALPEMIERYGGNPVMWKTGHSLLKKKMKEVNSPLAGEMSGHLFFADRYFGFDDAIYASVRLAELVSRQDKKLSELLSDIPIYHATPEIRAETESDEIKFMIAEKARAYFSKEYEVNDIDGVRILFGDGWGLVRASNTQPVIVLRFEARTPERRDEIQNLVVSKLKEFGEIKI
jgi:phosphomannomutase/phosphoglucomutase